jgi:cation-transporting ATPase E
MAQDLAGSGQRPALESTGLTAAQVAERQAAGQVNDPGRQPTRTVAQILVANIATRFNAILGALFIVIAVVGPLQDGLFGLVLVANSGIGIVQEVRAKRTLDRLSVLNAPTAAVLRDGTVSNVPAATVVLDDIVELWAGDQVVVDGLVLYSGGLEIDESLLSGEADPVIKEPGSEVLSGSFVVAGSGRIRATKVGATSYAAELAGQARSYSPARSEIRDAINALLKWISWLLVPVGVLLVIRQSQSGQTADAALRGSEPRRLSISLRHANGARLATTAGVPGWSARRTRSWPAGAALAACSAGRPSWPVRGTGSCCLPGRLHSTGSRFRPE